MRKRSLVVLILLIVASVMAAMGTGALDVFRAKRTAAMMVVTDTDAYISLKGDGNYAYEKNNGELKLDFTSANNNVIGDGFNPQASSEFNEVFSVTNKSAKTVYVWFEAEGWSSQHNGGLAYVIEKTDGEVTKGIDTYKTNTLLTTTGWNFKDNKGSLAYVQLDPGEYFSVKILVNTVMSNGYGDANTYYSNWGHKVIVKANVESPSRP